MPAATAEDGSIVLLEAQSLEGLSYRDPDGVAVVMPSIDTARATEAARILVRRAGMPTHVFIAEDTHRQGFIRTLNTTAAALDVKYVVYLAEDALPGSDWLSLAYEKLETTGKGLLAFNDGKWRGRIASFGMVRKSWVKNLYGGPIFYAGYRTHRADNELTVIARATGQSIYAAECALLENDTSKIFRRSETDASNFSLDDKNLFIARFNSCFEGIVTPECLEPLRDEYLSATKLDRIKRLFTQR